MFAAFIPIWALTLIGYVAGRFRLIGEDADRVLGGFVFHIAMPAALFTTLSRTRLSVSGPGIAVFAASTVITMFAGYLLSRRLFDRKPGESLLGGMSAGYVNSANLGIPVALHVLGNASFLTGVLLFQVLVVTPVILASLDSGLRLRRLVTLPLRNPVILGLAAGAACSITGWRPPPVVADPLALLGAAAVPTALVALGLSLNVRGPAMAGRTEVFALSALKLAGQPLVAYALGALIALPAADLRSLVVCAALPTAQNVYIFAREYGQAEAVTRWTVLAGTALSMATLAVADWLLST
ncbi:AEC family transporter [Nonomuraea sp. NPDC050536]|uniref:AEC family transporter n=1 Tax=Nonomuraea sp. NPDC050536 TaxID=3364366 RepID=UPI0037CB3FB0